MKKKILVIEDEQDIREMMTYQLESEEYEVAAASDGLEGLEALEKGFEPDLIILDMNMPRMGGIEFYHKICDNESKPKYPVLVVTARANVKEFFQDFDVAGFMLKPVEIEELMKYVDAVVKKSERTDKVSSSKADIKRICVVETRSHVLQEIKAVFDGSGYDMMYETEGHEAMMRIINHPVNLALINVQLDELNGDLLALRLKRNLRTDFIKSMVYVTKDQSVETNLMLNDREKSGIFNLVKCTEAQELLEAVDQYFNKKNKK